MKPGCKPVTIRLDIQTESGNRFTLFSTVHAKRFPVDTSRASLISDPRRRMALRLEIPSPNHIPTDSMTESDQLSSATENNRRFRQHFEDVMPSSRKPKQYESGGVLMLSFDPKCTVKGVKSMDVSGEVQRAHSYQFPMLIFHHD